MQLAVVAPDTIHHTTTAATARLDRLLQGLVDRDHEVIVFTQRWTDSNRAIEVRDTSSATSQVVDTASITYQWLTDRPDSRRQFQTRLPGAIRSLGPDLVHAYQSPGGVLAARAGTLFSRRPLIGEWYHPPGTGVSSRFSVSRPDRTIVPSELLDRELREHGIASTAITTIPTPIDFSTITTIEPDSQAEIVFTGSLDAAANLESFLLGLAELRDRNWSAVVIGDGPAKADYEQQAAELRIDDRLSFIGPQSYHDRIAIYRGAHVAVHTSGDTPFAHEFLTALASGCIGIVEYQATSSAHELLVGIDRGFRITTPQELAAAIETASNMAHRDLDSTFRSYDRSAILDQYLAVYRDVLSE